MGVNRILHFPVVRRGWRDRTMFGARAQQLSHFNLIYYDELRRQLDQHNRDRGRTK